MKLNIFYSLLAVASVASLAACDDQDYTQLDKGNEPLVITASQSEIVLDEASHASDAIELSWTTGTNNGTGNRIYYTLELAQADTEFAESVYLKSNVTQSYSWTPTVEELNNILIDKLHATAGIPMELEARVIATVAGYEDEEQISVCRFTATPYEAVTSTLYIIGDATSTGWSADNAAEMTRTDNGIFTWTGNLHAGNFKFITTRGEFVPSYNNDGTGKLVYRSSFDEPDEQFTVENSATYKIDVNLFTLTMSIQESASDVLAYDKIFFVGDVTGWGFEPMNQDPLDKFLFRIGVTFPSAGEFKFGTTSGSWENMYKAGSDHASYTSQAVQFVQGFDPDPKWYITDADANKSYKICLDIRSGRERMIATQFTPYQCIYLIGSATSAGWSIGDALPMTASATDPNIMTWSGALTEGELKFTCDKQSDWGGAWFLATSSNATPTGTTEKTLFIDKSSNSFADQYLDIAVGDVDLKWNITQAGNYTITLNQLTEEISIVKK